jgi:RHS repeat-associated protein
MNRIQSQDPGGTLRFSGTVDEAAKVTIQNKPAIVNADNTFGGTAMVSSGTSTVEVKATDYAGNTRTNTYEVGVTGSSKAFTHDANGNMTGDGTRTFEWDGENRLVAINQGTHRSEFTYDGQSRRIRIVEKDNSVTTSDQRFLWCNLEICEERDSTGSTTTKRFFAEGEQQGSDNFFYTRDHLGSVREITETSLNVSGRYDYSPHGRTTKISGDRDSSFTFTGHYSHAPSGLLQTHYRIYEPNLGRWLSEDPSGLSSGLNLYRYVENACVNLVDPTGLISNSPFCRRLREKIDNVSNRIRKRIGELDENPLGLPESCAGDSVLPRLSRRGHRRLINEDKALLAALEAMYAARCANRPPPVPTPTSVPVPAPPPLPSETPEKAATALTTGLVLYLIISEGSRLFLPRNLIPVP